MLTLNKLSTHKPSHSLILELNNVKLSSTRDVLVNVEHTLSNPKERMDVLITKHLFMQGTI